MNLDILLILLLILLVLIVGCLLGANLPVRATVGGADESGPIIHIAGASGSGKTTLGKKLSSYFGGAVIVKDLDELREEHFNKNEKTDISPTEFAKNYNESFQQFIDEFINISKTSKKPIIIVGINKFITNAFMFKNKEFRYSNHTFNTHANYKFYLYNEPDIILKQLFDREYSDYLNWFYKWMSGRKDIVFQNLLNDENTAKNDMCMALTRIMNFKIIKKNINTWDKSYKKEEYEFLSGAEIYEKIIKLLGPAV